MSHCELSTSHNLNGNYWKVTKLKIRDFNTLEFTSWVLSSSSPHNGIVALKLNEKADLTGLETALVLAIKNQPMLSVTINSEASGFFTTNSILTIEKIDDNRALKEICDAELAKEFKYGDSLVRFFYINNLDYLICVFHHIIGDAASCIQLLNGVLNIYYGKSSDIKFTEENFPNFLDVYPKSNISLFIRDSICSNNITKTDYVVFSGDTYVEMIRNFNNRFISINSQIAFFLFKAACESFNLNYYTINMPFNLRRLRNITSDDRLSFFTSYVSCEIGVENTMEDISKKTRAEFLKGRPMINIHRTNEILSEVTSGVDFINRFSSYEPSLVISSNKINTGDKLSYISDLLIFVNAQNYFSSSGSFTIQYGLTESSLSICVSYPHPLVNQEKINLFFNNLKKLLI